jgi:hypothetical protein
MADITEQQLMMQDPEVLGLQRQRQLANLLTGQAFNQPQGQMISGHYVKPSALQQALPMINAAIGGLTNANLDTKQTELAAALRGKQSEVMQAWQQAKTPQEKFAIGTSQYAPKELQAATYEMLKPQKLGEGETINQMNFGSGQYEPMAQGNQKKTEAIRGYELAKSQGFPGTFVEYETALKRAGAPSTTVTMGKSIAGEIGPMMKDAQGIAQAAVKTEDSANRIVQAIDSNKLFTGTGANVRLGAAQLANTLGFGGNTLEAKIGNTRQAMQGLAELTLQGRQQMRGQGAITESESKLAERAISGDINFTPGEIKQLANAAKRSSEYTYNNYQSKLQNMAKNPDTAGLVPYYEVPRMTTEGGWRVK